MGSQARHATRITTVANLVCTAIVEAADYQNPTILTAPH